VPTAYSPGSPGTLVDFGGEEVVWHLEHDPGAVAGVLLGTGGTPVFQVREQFETVLYDPVVSVAVEVHDDPDATVRPFVGGVREPCGARGPHQ